MIDEENKNSEDPHVKPNGLIGVGMYSLLALLVTSVSLTRGTDFPTWNTLYIVYFGYCASAIIFFHAVFFGINSFLRHKGINFRKKVPKLIEYAYAALISVSLLQIFFSSGRVADYLSLLVGNEQKMWEQIRDGARAHVTDDCSKQRTRFFTEEYCKEMQRIAEASDLKVYVFGTVMHNKAFLQHAIRQELVGGPEGGNVVDVYSPIVPMMTLLYSREEYSRLPINNVVANAYPWIALLLLPLGIALRLVKTSLELFGKLD